MPTNLDKSVPEDDLPNFLRTLLSAAKTFEKDLIHLAADTEKAHVYCMDALVVVEMMNRLGDLGIEMPKLDGGKESDIAEMRELVAKIEGKTISLLEVYGTEEDRELVSREKTEKEMYEFSDNDYERVQQLINELRQIVTRANLIGEDHRLRLLKRLEKLQLELHKQISDLDRFWGLLGDAGESIGKFGADAKPFIDRIRELLEIIRKTQSKGPKSLEGGGSGKLPDPEYSDNSSNE